MCWMCASRQAFLDTGRGASPQAAAPPAFSLASGIAAVATDYYWGPSTITYSIAVSGSPWVGYSGATLYNEPFLAQYSAFNTQQAAQFRLAIGRWDELIAASFTETSGAANSGNIRIAFTDVGAAAAYAYYPPFGGGVSASLYQGDIWFAHTSSGSAMLEGSYDFNTLLHEIGHSLGLKHSFEDGATLPTNLDNYRYSIMSYTAQADSTVVVFSSDAGGINAAYNSAEFITPSLYDIAAVQQRYGADPNTRSGNSTYVFDPASTSLQVIYDAGGIDTWNLSSHTRASDVDLREGAYSSIAILTKDQQAAAAVATHGAGYQAFINSILDGLTAGTLYEWRNNVAIAFGTVIENVNFGSANDRGLGNAAANVFNGGGGNDTLDGAGGNDTLIGGSGADSLIGDTGIDAVSYVGGAAGVTIRLDLGFGIDSGGATDTYATIENAIGTDFADVLVGLAGIANQIEGGLGDDTIYGEGIDIVFGGGGNNTFFTGAGAALNLNVAAAQLQTVWGGFLADTMNGGSSSANLTLIGQGPSGDSMTGGSGNDFIYFRAGDTISGGTGNDWAVATLSGSPVNLSLGATGFENAWGSTGNDTLSAATSGAGVVMVGDVGNDLLTGGAFADFIYGFGDNDTITGGGGNDVLDGGAGVDRFLYSTANFGTDQIYNFQIGTDKISVAGSGVTLFSQLALGTSGGNTSITAGAFGAGQIFVIGVTGLTAGDFLFV